MGILSVGSSKELFPSSVRHFKELPGSLDETYERVLGGIEKPNLTTTSTVLVLLELGSRGETYQNSEAA
jgi:hypothetical protein